MLLPLQSANMSKLAIYILALPVYIMCGMLGMVTGHGKLRHSLSAGNLYSASCRKNFQKKAVRWKQWPRLSVSPCYSVI